MSCINYAYTLGLKLLFEVGIEFKGLEVLQNSLVTEFILIRPVYIYGVGVIYNTSIGMHGITKINIIP